MIARIYSLKNGRVLLEISDILRESVIFRDVKSVSAAQGIMHRRSSDWELVQEIKIYKLKEKLIPKEESNVNEINSEKKRNIMDYLGIDPTTAHYKENRCAMKEAESIEKEYRAELDAEKYSYSFHGDVDRCYDKKTETIRIIKLLEYLTVFEVIPKEKTNTQGEKR